MLKKKDFLKRFSKKGYTLKDAETIMIDFLNTIEEIMVEGDSVMFHGFGTFGSIERKDRRSINVKDGSEIIIPAFRSPKFDAGIELRRSVREGFIRK